MLQSYELIKENSIRIKIMHQFVSVELQLITPAILNTDFIMHMKRKRRNAIQVRLIS